MKKILRLEAKANGLKKYFTGEPCKRMHISERRVSDGHCVECDKLKDTAERFRLQRLKNGRPSQSASSAKHYEKNKKARIAAVINYTAKRKETDQKFAMKLRIMSLIIHSLKSRGYKKTTKTAKILGCSPEEFKRHIELQFTHGMSWGNRSEWHIDHIVPLSTATCEQELIALNHHTNLRPLWAHKNLEKGAVREHLI